MENVDKLVWATFLHILVSIIDWLKNVTRSFQQQQFLSTVWSLHASNVRLWPQTQLGPGIESTWGGEEKKLKQEFMIATDMTDILLIDGFFNRHH